jgi:hypothetical protein
MTTEALEESCNATVPVLSEWPKTDEAFGKASRELAIGLKGPKLATNEE